MVPFRQASVVASELLVVDAESDFSVADVTAAGSGRVRCMEVHGGALDCPDLCSRSHGCIRRTAGAAAVFFSRISGVSRRERA